MRVVLVNEWGGAAGGTESYVHAAAEGLHQRGHQVGFLYARRTAGELPPLDAEMRCPQLSGRGPADRAAVVAKIAAFSPDVVHVNRLGSWDPVRWIATEFPTVVFFHDFSPIACPGFGRFLKSDETVCERRVGPFCAVAPWIQSCGSRRPWVHWRRYGESQAARADLEWIRRVLVASRFMGEEMIRNGVASDRLSVVGLPAPKPWGTPGGGDGLLYVGRLTRDKGPHVLIEAMARLRRPSRVVLAGEGPERAGLAALAARLRVSAEFPGFLSGEALRKAYERAACVVMPSLWPEPFGLVGLEAMAAARPVVAFARGGIPEWLRDGETGRLVPRATPEALASALDDILSHRGHRTDWGSRAREAVLHHSSEAHFDRLLAAYHEASPQSARSSA